MATKLFLRETTTTGIGSFRDALTTAGSSITTGVVNTTASGTNIQWTKTAGGSVLEWITGRAPAGGFTMSGTISFSIWAIESNMSANAGARIRLYRRSSGGTETECTGSPWDDGVEFPFGSTIEHTWTGTATGNNVFSENDRLVIRVFITGVGTMGAGFTCTMSYDAADGDTGDSFVQINENVTFKDEPGAVEEGANLSASATLLASSWKNTGPTSLSASVSATLLGTAWKTCGPTSLSASVSATLLASAWSTDNANASSPNATATLLASAWSSDNANAASLSPTAALVLGIFTAIDNDAASRSATATLFAEGDIASPGEDFTSWAYTKFPLHNFYIGPV